MTMTSCMHALPAAVHWLRLYMHVASSPCAYSYSYSQSHYCHIIVKILLGIARPIWLKLHSILPAILYSVIVGERGRTATNVTIESCFSTVPDCCRMH